MQEHWNEVVDLFSILARLVQQVDSRDFRVLTTTSQQISGSNVAKLVSKLKQIQPDGMWSMLVALTRVLGESIESTT